MKIKYIFESIGNIFFGLFLFCLVIIILMIIYFIIWHIPYLFTYALGAIK